MAYLDDEGELPFTVDGEVAGVPSVPIVEWWETDPDGILGMDSGSTHRMDRTRAIGNIGVPPMVYAHAFRELRGRLIQ